MHAFRWRELAHVAQVLFEKGVDLRATEIVESDLQESMRQAAVAQETAIRALMQQSAQLAAGLRRLVSAHRDSGSGEIRFHVLHCCRGIQQCNLA